MRTYLGLKTVSKVLKFCAYFGLILNLFGILFYSFYFIPIYVMPTTDSIGVGFAYLIVLGLVVFVLLLFFFLLAFSEFIMLCINTSNDIQEVADIMKAGQTNEMRKIINDEI